MSRRKVIIIGGGIAGLTAALHLAERGLQPLILEANPDYCGGRIAATLPANLNGTISLGEYNFPAEHGIHGLWWQYWNLKGMLARHSILPELQLAQSQEWIHSQGDKVRRTEMGKLVRRSPFPAPFHYTLLWFTPSFWRMIGWRDWFSIPTVMASLVVAAGIDPLAEGRQMEGLTLEDFCSGWSPNIRSFVATLARSGLSEHPDKVPLSGFIAFLRFYTLLRRDSQKFEYLTTDSNAALVAPLVAKILELGGQIMTGTHVTRLEQTKTTDAESSGWEVFYQPDGTELETSIECDHLIIATDAPAARHLMQSSPPTAELSAGMHFPRGIKTAIVRFWFSASPSSKAEAGIISGDFTVDNFFWLHRFQKPFAAWHAATGGSAVEAHIYGPPELLDEPDEVLFSRAEYDFARMYPALKGKIINRTLQRNAATHTLFEMGSLAQHPGIRTIFQGLYCCGDWVRHPTPALFLERACVTGLAAANAVLENSQLEPYPLIPHQRPEWLARLTSGYVNMLRIAIPARARRNHEMNKD